MILMIFFMIFFMDFILRSHSQPNFVVRKPVEVKPELSSDYQTLINEVCNYTICLYYISLYFY